MDLDDLGSVRAAGELALLVDVTPMGSCYCVRWGSRGGVLLFHTLTSLCQKNLNRKMVNILLKFVFLEPRRPHMVCLCSTIPEPVAVSGLVVVLQHPMEVK